MTVEPVGFCDVLAASGTSESQLVHWTRVGVVPGLAVAPGSGNRRRWSRHQVRVVAALRQLNVSNGGLDVDALRTVAERLDVADWTRPLVLRLTGHVTALVDLPGIDAETTLRLRSRTACTRIGTLNAAMGGPRA